MATTYCASKWLEEILQQSDKRRGKKKRHAVTNGKKISIVYNFKLKGRLIFTNREEEKWGKKENEKKDFPDVIFATTLRLVASLL